MSSIVIYLAHLGKDEFLLSQSLASGLKTKHGISNEYPHCGIVETFPAKYYNFYLYISYMSILYEHYTSTFILFFN